MSLDKLMRVRPIAGSGANSNTAPAANSVIADTGPLPAGSYRIVVQMGCSGTAAAGKGLTVRHRNAANNGNINSGPHLPCPGFAAFELPRVDLANNERVRVDVDAVAFAAAEVAGARIYAYKIAGGTA